MGPPYTNLLHIQSPLSFLQEQQCKYYITPAANDSQHFITVKWILCKLWLVLCYELIVHFSCTGARAENRGKGINNRNGGLEDENNNRVRQLEI